MPDVPLVIVESPYRSLVEPIIAYIEALDRTQPNQMVTVVLPEFVPKHFWQRFLHNQLSLAPEEGPDRPAEHGRRRRALSPAAKSQVASQQCWQRPADAISFGSMDSDSSAL